MLKGKGREFAYVVVHVNVVTISCEIELGYPATAKTQPYPS